MPRSGCSALQGVNPNNNNKNLRRLFTDFLISSKMMKNNLVEDVRDMQTQLKAWEKR